MCGSRKYPYPHHRGSFGNSEEEGGGALKVKILKECMHEPNWNFQRGGGSNQKILCGGGKDIF